MDQDLDLDPYWFIKKPVTQPKKGNTLLISTGKSENTGDPPLYFFKSLFEYNVVNPSANLLTKVVVHSGRTTI